MTDYQAAFAKIDPPFGTFERSILGEDFAAELEVTSGLWFRCGYRPGIAAYLNFFLLRDFTVRHDEAFPPRFASFRSMAKSFYDTDLFIRAVTDSGREPTGGISSRAVRRELRNMMTRHHAVAIPGWMMTYFGFSLLENVEKQCEPMAAADKQRHLAYMARTYRIMGVSFSDRRELMEAFGRDVEGRFAGVAPQVERRARDILLVGEMIGVPSKPEVILAMLPEPTRRLFEPLAAQVRPPAWRRALARGLGRVLMKRAVGEPRKPIPVEA